MTKEISIYNFKNNSIRITTKSGEPWFCVVDLRKALNIPANSRMIQGLTKGFAKSELLSDGGKQQTYFCSEKDLYKITLRSNSPLAEPFVDWVCGEVLPSIRKTGSYGTQPTLPLPSPEKDETLTIKDRSAIGGMVKRCVSKVIDDKFESGIRANLKGFPTVDGMAIVCAYDEIGFETRIERCMTQAMETAFVGREIIKTISPLSEEVLPDDLLNNDEIKPRDLADLIHNIRLHIDRLRTWKNKDIEKLYRLFLGMENILSHYWTIQSEGRFSLFAWKHWQDGKLTSKRMESLMHLFRDISDSPIKLVRKF